MNAVIECAEWLARGRDHQREGRPVDAMLCFRRASRADARAADPHFALGEVLWQLARIGDAIGAWREAARLEPLFHAPWQALAEALLATGDAAGARDAAKRVLALAPGNTRAEMVVGIAGWPGDAASTGPTPLALVGRALEREPALVAVPTLAGPLALAIDRSPRTPEQGALLANLARMDIVRAHAPVQLVAQMVEHLAVEGNEESDALRAMLCDSVRARAVAPSDADALRRIAVAVATTDLSAAGEFAGRYAALCASSMTPPVSPLWPMRTAGTRTRVFVLARGDDVDSATLATVAGLSREAFAITIATMGAASFPLPQDAAAIVLPPAPDAGAAKAIAALDPDVLVDFAGMTAASGPFLAQHPARATWTLDVRPLAHAAPLVDRAFADDRSLAAALAALHDARDPANDCALDAAAMAAAWTEAVREHQRGDRAAAIAGYARVLALQPGFATAHYLAGVAHRDDGEEAGAQAAFAAALEAAPRYVEARIAAANAATAAGDAAAAVALCQDGLAASPLDAGLLRSLGRANLARRDAPAAADAFARALQVDMSDADTHYNFGAALQMGRDLAEAARAYQRAIAFRPDFAEAHFNLGVLFQEQGMTDGAVTAYGEVLAAEPGNVAAYRNLGEVLLASGRIDAYLANFARFEARCPDTLPLAVQALVACQHMGNFAKLEQYVDGLRRERFVARSETELVDALEELLFLLLYFDVEPSMLAQFARTYDSAARHVYGEPLPRPAVRRPGRVRVGYLSADLRNHVMGKMTWAAVERHDKARFELFFYSLSPSEDEWTAKFRGIADHYHAFAGEGEREAAMRIAADDLDLLVDLQTHTKGARPGVLALKPARVQITHLASAGTTGLSTIDFKLTDRYADLPENQELQLEKLLFMDGCAYPYRHVEAAATHPFHRAALGIAADAVVMAAFVNPLKLSRRCLSTWQEVLARIPKARLAFSPADPATRGTYARLLAAAGIAADRALFLPQGRNDGENQARYALIDVVLDPMPYGGVNGTLEALDMGVPVVTLLGRRHGERTTYSILANLGVTQTVAASGREYADIAVRLATDPAFMRDVRDQIRRGLGHSALTDMPGHTRSLERAYLAALAANAPELPPAADERRDG